MKSSLGTIIAEEYRINLSREFSFTGGQVIRLIRKLPKLVNISSLSIDYGISSME